MKVLSLPRARFALVSSTCILASVLPFSAFAQISPANLKSLVQVQQLPGVEVRNDFQLGPTRFQVSLEPGAERRLEVEVTNRMGRTATFTFETEDFAAGDNASDSTKLFGLVDGPYSARRWLNPAVTSIELRHGERAYIPVMVRVPRDASVGDHYAALLLKRDLEPGEGTGGVSVISRVGALFLITVEGDVVEDGHLVKLDSLKKIYWRLPVQLQMDARNDGTVHMEPQGNVAIRNLFGLTVDEVPFQNWFVLRNSSRSVTLTWKPSFALGYYTAETNATIYGKQAEVLKTGFFVIPALPVLLVLLAIFLVSFLVQFFFSRFEIKRK